MSQKPPELLPPAADCATVVRLKRIHEEENSSITNRPARCTYPEKKSVLTSGATPAGVPVKELCRANGFSDASFYKWRGRFGGMEASDARRLKELESENTKLKQLLAEAMLDNEALRVVARGKR